jgi:hypothetical protein
MDRIHSAAAAFVGQADFPSSAIGFDAQFDQKNQ